MVVEDFLGKDAVAVKAGDFKAISTDPQLTESSEAMSKGVEAILITVTEAQNADKCVAEGIDSKTSQMVILTGALIKGKKSLVNC